MKVTIESTDKIVHLNGVPARVWEGHTTDSGIAVHCFITRMAISQSEPDEIKALFEKELSEQSPPSAEIEKYPLRLIL